MQTGCVRISVAATQIPCWPVVLAVCWCCLSACQRPVVYEAAALPEEFRVPDTLSTQKPDLLRLAAPTPNGNLIGEGDLLEIMIATGYRGEQNYTALLRVDAQGHVNVPIVGKVPVGGLDAVEAEQVVAATAIERGIYRRPYVTVNVKRKRSHSITVVGAVREPGTYDLSTGNSDLLGALAVAGGLTDEAGREVSVLRKGSAVSTPPPPPSGATLAQFSEQPVDGRPHVLKVNLTDARQLSGENLQLGDGDVVVVPPDDPGFVHVMGLVRKPGQFEIPVNRDLRLLDALALAGGRTIQVADRVRIIRQVAGQPAPVIINASVGKAKKSGAANLRLAAGDLVSVEETPVTFFVETLRSFVRFGFSAATPLF